ncbi:hypothetical protein [Halodesulfovibrio marinisediminis]|uniref:Secreted protein n=1 Tax=Halodesulfovibrio marinisediminis DSM 17456 TaxID=1121457 RepID=A0A1N6IAX9_9BACT|nr:hypothetical protein [Halodesulfovibrio marinisediminis]SIO29198.1 hypothetical protein SAMN02745161_2586 [Halodesulfovibrio marinisediminis DSM 17456]
MLRNLMLFIGYAMLFAMLSACTASMADDYGDNDYYTPPPAWAPPCEVNANFYFDIHGHHHHHHNSCPYWGTPDWAKPPKIPEIHMPSMPKMPEMPHMP